MIDKFHLVCFEIITNSGNAKALYLDAIKEAKKYNFENAMRLIKKGEDVFIVAHKAHSKLVTKEARGEEIKTSIFLIHAEDHLTNVECFKLIAEEFIEVYKKMQLMENKN